MKFNPKQSIGLVVLALFSPWLPADDQLPSFGQKMQQQRVEAATRLAQQEAQRRREAEAELAKTKAEAGVAKQKAVENEAARRKLEQEVARLRDEPKPEEVEKARRLREAEAALQKTQDEAKELRRIAKEAQAEAARQSALREAARRRQPETPEPPPPLAEPEKPAMPSMTKPAPSTARAEAKPLPKDCAECPEMVELPPGEFLMGSPESEPERDSDEGPQHRVSIGYRLAVGKFEVSFAEWDACVAAGGCALKSEDRGWGRGNRPVINVSWNDAQAYIRWLNGRPPVKNLPPAQRYRLLSEAEWEYAARAGTATPFATGNCISTAQANYDGNVDYHGCGANTGQYLQKTQPVGSYPANGFGLDDLHGNVWEWVQDCYHGSYQGAPQDGSAWEDGAECANGRVVRGGSWSNVPRFLRSAIRYGDVADDRYNIRGFRLARTLTP